jgi:hypothetical protein
VRFLRAARFLYVLPVLPVAASLCFVGVFGVNVVVGDQWEMAALFRKLSAGTLSFWDLWQPHNEHRFLFPRMAMLALGALTGWNNVAEMYLFQACLALTLLVLCLSLSERVRARPLLLVPVALLVFSPRQWSNMLWGYQLTFALTLLFAVLALFCLQASSRLRLAGNKYRGGIIFGAAILCATVASGSSIQGLLVWPAGFLQLLIPLSSLREKVWVLIAWVGAAVTVWTLYFLGYDARLGSENSEPPVLAFLSQPLASVEHVLTLLGSSLLPALFAGVASGALLAALVALTVVLIWRSERPHDYAFWLSLLAFSLLVLLAVTAGRGVQDPDDALVASRYTTFSLLTVASVYAMLVEFRLARRSHLASGLLLAACAMILFSAPFSYRNALDAATQHREARIEAAEILATYDSRSDQELADLNRHPEVVRRNAVALERLDYNVFASR